jgi:TetR/AcrR family transcriptional regulator, mexJK operon transcriptional repressor
MDENTPNQVFRQLLNDLDLPRVPQQARSRQKRDALLAAAGRLFAERGYEATTADDIAAAADVSIGTFYSYFRNKRQLLFTLYATCLESLEALQIDQADFATDPWAAIRAMINQAMERDPMFYGLQRAWLELLPKDAEAATYDAHLNQAIYGQILTAVRRAVAAGLTWPDLKVEETCWVITLLLDKNWQTQSNDQQTEQQRARHLDALTDMIYRAVFQQPVRHPND